MIPRAASRQELRDVGGERAPHLEAEAHPRRCATARTSALASMVRVHMPTGKAPASRSSGQPLASSVAACGPLQPAARPAGGSHRRASAAGPRARARAPRRAADCAAGAMQQPLVGPEPQRRALAAERRRGTPSPAASRPSASAAASRTASSPRSTQRQAGGSERSHGVSRQRRSRRVPRSGQALRRAPVRVVEHRRGDLRPRLTGACGHVERLPERVRGRRRASPIAIERPSMAL